MCHLSEASFSGLQLAIIHICLGVKDERHLVGKSCHSLTGCSCDSSFTSLTRHTRFRYMKNPTFQNSLSRGTHSNLKNVFTHALWTHQRRVNMHTWKPVHASESAFCRLTMIQQHFFSACQVRIFLKQERHSIEIEKVIETCCGGR